MDSMVLVPGGELRRKVEILLLVMETEVSIEIDGD